jgi:hypothetical protein
MNSGERLLSNVYVGAVHLWRDWEENKLVLNKLVLKKQVKMLGKRLSGLRVSNNGPVFAVNLEIGQGNVRYGLRDKPNEQLDNLKFPRNIIMQ